jgi:hypothetical protein
MHLSGETAQLVGKISFAVEGREEDRDLRRGNAARRLSRFGTGRQTHRVVSQVHHALAPLT